MGNGNWVNYIVLQLRTLIAVGHRLF